MSGNAIIAHDEKITPETLIKAINDAGLKATREGEKSDEDAQQRQKKRLVSVSISGAFTLLGVLVHWTHFAPKSAAIALFLVAIISGGWFIAPKAVTAARRLAPDMHLLMTIAVLGAAGIGEWSEGAAAHDTILGFRNPYVDHIAGSPCSGEANGALRALQGYSEGRSGIGE
jgi:Zn2+/Cd2+-exporting ATPase